MCIRDRSGSWSTPSGRLPRCQDGALASRWTRRRVKWWWCSRGHNLPGCRYGCGLFWGGVARVLGAELDVACGELHEGLFQGSRLAGELVNHDALLKGKVADGRSPSLTSRDAGLPPAKR